MKQTLIVIAICIIGLFLARPFYTLDETEQVIITQFGKPIGTAVTDAGLHFKLPFIQVANIFPKNLLEWDGDPGQIPTKDKTFIWVDSFARWRIKDPLTFYKAVINERAAQKKLDDILDAATYNFITSNNLIEAVRTSNRIMELENINQEMAGEKSKRQQVTIAMGREQMTRAILEQAAPKLEKFGIEMVDLRIKRINYVEEVRRKVYDRMIAERKQISEKFRSEGKGESKKIEGERQKELRRIKSGSYRTAEEIKGKADGEATRIYAAALNKDPEFYSFMTTLEQYRKALDGGTRLILSTKSDFFKYLQSYAPKR
ncbi:MAG: protease modulator HflC [Deltaproteobacteria bacterium]|nr:protease modulator HflC [Deltaproteobacteria bacterium]